MVVAFFGMFRKDNITSGNASVCNPRAHLCVGDLLVTQEGVVWLKVRHSKTNQFRTADAESSVVPSEGSAESIGNSSEFGLEPRNGLVPMEWDTWPGLCHDTRCVRAAL